MLESIIDSSILQIRLNGNICLFNNKPEHAPALLNVKAANKGQYNCANTYG